MTVLPSNRLASDMIDLLMVLISGAYMRPSQIRTLYTDIIDISQTSKLIACIDNNGECPSDITHTSVIFPTIPEEQRSYPPVPPRTRSILHIPSHHIPNTKRDLLITVSYPVNTNEAHTSLLGSLIRHAIHTARQHDHIASIVLEITMTDTLLTTTTTATTIPPHTASQRTVYSTHYTLRNNHIIHTDHSVTTPTSTPAIDCTQIPCVALTFDDGPSKHTERLLDILDEHNILATFYVLGSAVRSRPTTVQRAFEQGHEIGNHTWTHRNLKKLSAQEIFEDIAKSDEIIYQLIGHTPQTYRPPYGAHSAYIDRIIDKACIMRNIDSNDRRHLHADTVLRNVQHARAGSIILTHDLHKTTVDAVPQIIDYFHKKGYTFVTVSDLLAATDMHPGISYYSQYSFKDYASAYYKRRKH